MALKTLICPSCGGKIENFNNNEVGHCPYCDTLVYKKASTSTSQPIQNNNNRNEEKDHSKLIESAKKAFNKQHYIECLSYCKRILEHDEDLYAIWYMKGICLFLIGDSDRFNHAIESLVIAYNKAGKKQITVKKNIEDDMYDIAKAIVLKTTHEPYQDYYIKSLIPKFDDFTLALDKLTSKFGTDYSKVTTVIADLITNEAIKAYKSVVLPGYEQEDHPDSNTFSIFIDRSDNCISALDYSFQLVDSLGGSKKDNVNRGKAIIEILYKTIESCSYKKVITDDRETWQIDRVLTSNSKEERLRAIDNLRVNLR